MRPLENFFADAPWLGVALFQATFVASLGVVVWLAVRRRGPAFRGAVLLATLVGALAVPAIGSFSPVWVPVPKPELPAISVLELPGTVNDPSTGLAGSEELPPIPDGAGTAMPAEDDRPSQPAENKSAPAALAAAPAISPSPSSEPVRGGRWSLAQILTALWIAGSLLCLLHALVKLALLHSYRRCSLPIRDAEWTGNLQELAAAHGLGTIELRESPAIASPLALGLRRPVILLPAGWRHWSAEQRALILAHELAHIRRRDFVTALLAELAVCLYWFHPLVRWLAGRLRLEQEYAADAWVVSAKTDANSYLCCLAQLALEMDQGTGSLAPALWRRRPEIMRRIDMLRRHTLAQTVHLGRWARGLVVMAALAAYAVVAGVGFLHSADPAAPKADDKKAAEVKLLPDLYGDPMPFGATMRLGTVRFRHNSTAIAYSPDGKILASGGRDNEIRLFEAASGKEIRRLVGHKARSYTPAKDDKNPVGTLVNATGEGGVNSVAFSPDGKVLASGGWDDTLRLWNVETGKEIRKIDAHKAMVGRVLFSPDGKVLASRGGLDGTVKVWDPATGAQLQKIVGLNNINPWRFNHDMALAISPDSKTLVTTARNTIQDGDPAAKKTAKPGCLLFYDIGSGQELKRLESNSYGITVAYSPDGKMLATGGVDPGTDVYSLRIWDVAAGKELRKCTLPKNEPPTYISWDPNNNGRFAAVIAEDNMHIFDANTGKAVVDLKHYWPSRVIYSKDGKIVTSAGSGPTIRHWDAATGNELYLEFEGHRNGVAAVAVTPDGKRIASGGESIRLWDAATGKVAHKIDVKGGVACLAFSPDGKLLASGGRDRLVHLWDAETGKSQGELKGHKNGICGLAFSRDGKLLASGDVQSTVKVWDVKDAKEIKEIDNKSGTETLSMAFAPDNKTLICAGAHNDSSFLPKAGDTIKINGKEVKFDGIINIQGVAMSRKEGNFVLQWDIDSGKEVRKFGGLKDKIRSLAFSPDGKLVAAASKDGKVCIWDAQSGAEKLHIVAHPDHKDAAFSGSPCLAFAPDSKTLASASTDGTIRLWDVTSAKETGQFRAPDSAFYGITFAKEGKALIAGSADTTVLIWDVGLAGTPPPKDKSASITLQ
jgi:WD40 repeat protein/beta-lactamase regulating signal transducer with metallopeptidase domain